MRIELLPVLELGYHNPALAAPPARRYWEDPAPWASYRAAGYRQAGFGQELPMYAPGSPFCRLPALSDASLVKIIADHTAGWRGGEYDREQASNLYGGYVLRVDGRDAWFPQCCGGLSDIRYWERLAQGQPSACEGHPAPAVTFGSETLVLDFAVRPLDEPFEPPPAVLTLTLSRVALPAAVAGAQAELADFARRLERLNAAAGLGIEVLAQLLIWQDGRHD